jgi:hypothetical protein
MNGGAAQLEAVSELSLRQPTTGKAVFQPITQFSTRHHLLIDPAHAAPSRCSTVSIIVQPDHGEHRFRDRRSRQLLPLSRRSS